MSDPAPSRVTLSDIVLTLPLAIVVGLTTLLTVGLVASIWAAFSARSPLSDMAAQMAVVLLPLLAAMIAAIGIRRSSSREIDRLVARFLDVAVLDRLTIACKDHARSGYPFSSATLEAPSRGRSYAYFRLQWADDPREPVRVGVKMNLFNIEVIASLSLHLADGTSLQPGSETYLISAGNLSEITRHDLLRRFQGAIQGSVEEGYAVRLSMRRDDARRSTMHVSLRQKLRENILSSPFLRRYFAEDIAIVVGVLFEEWRQSELAAAAVKDV